ncbi:MAG TPA: transketolase C-terminal domain-containing protein [Candidatus Sulfotelmatobacter sp.]|jgi:transketolase|nr:transketolase C-terminal domain-containing protein [Candidatus Sulfotelmatobacter sp.]
MRSAFIRAITALAERDERVHLIVGDLGFGVVENFAQRFPKQFLNAGVAEQNMTGVAAGMALSGKIAFTYSIANFPILRCLEQIRNDVCYHRANVKIVAVGGGLAYGSLGSTHHATEDIAIMRALPRMVVVAPGDPMEAEAATEAIASHSGPCYLRLGRAGEASVHQEKIDFQLGKAIQVRDGKDFTLVSTGGLLETAVQLAEYFRHTGLRARVLSMHTVKPIDSDAILAAARETRAIFTLEEHSLIGGLGGAVAEVLAEAGTPGTVFKKFGLPSEFSSVIGTQEYIRAKYGLSVVALTAAIRSTLKNEPTFSVTTAG